METKSLLQYTSDGLKESFIYSKVHRIQEWWPRHLHTSGLHCRWMYFLPLTLYITEPRQHRILVWFLAQRNVFTHTHTVPHPLFIGLLQNRIHQTSCLQSCPLMDIRVFSSFCPLWMSLPWRFLLLFTVACYGLSCIATMLTKQVPSLDE